MEPRRLELGAKERVQRRARSTASLPCHAELRGFGRKPEMSRQPVTEQSEVIGPRDGLNDAEE